MKSEAKFKLTLKELMKTTSIDDISVTFLCKKCNCHRQTFYYHYQNIYDLIADIFLNEEMAGFDQTKDIKACMLSGQEYAKNNFQFLKAVYSSSAKDLPDDFFFGKFRQQFVSILTKGRKENGLKPTECRNAARRLARILSDEFGDVFKENTLGLDRFVKKTGAFIERACEILVPAILLLSKEAAK